MQFCTLYERERSINLPIGKSIVICPVCPIAFASMCSLPIFIVRRLFRWEKKQKNFEIGKCVNLRTQNMWLNYIHGLSRLWDAYFS